MKIKICLPAIAGLLLSLSAYATEANPLVTALMHEYQAQGAGPADAERGKQLWLKQFPSGDSNGLRSCRSCHGENPAAMGKHITTGRKIEPMAPAVNPDRLTRKKKIEKWFRRNCKWTLGRECSAQEKSDVLLYLNKPVLF